MTTLTIPDDLSIPAFLLRKDTPEEKAGRERQIKQSQRGGVRRVVRSGGRSTISNGHAANLDEVGKAILKEVKAAEKHKREERSARRRELRKESAMLKGPKEAALQDKRGEIATAIESLAKPGRSRRLKDVRTPEQNAKLEVAREAHNEAVAKVLAPKSPKAKKLPETTAPLADLSAAELKAHAPKPKKTKRRALAEAIAAAATPKATNGTRPDGLRTGTKNAILLDAAIAAGEKGSTWEALAKKVGWTRCTWALKNVCKITHAKLTEKDGRVFVTPKKA